MNRHALVAAASSAVIAGSLAYAAAGAAALDGVQFKWAGKESFGYVAMVNGGYLDVCNPSPVPVRLDSLSIDVLYRGGDFGSFEAEGGIIGPGQSASLPGEGRLHDPGVGILATYMDTEAGGADLARFDSGDVSAVATASTLVVGVVPFSVERMYTGDELGRAMDGLSGYDC